MVRLWNAQWRVHGQMGIHNLFFKEEQSLGNSIQTAVYTESRF